MKKKNLKSLRLNKKSVSSLNIKEGIIGGAQSANVRDCPDNTLAVGCESLGACNDSYWCQGMTVNLGNGTTCWTACYEDCLGM